MISTYITPAIISAIIGFLTAYSTVSHKMGKLEGSTNSIEKGMSRLENRFDNFLLGIYKEKSSEVNNLIEKFKGYLDGIRNKNPITKVEKERIVNYYNKIKSREAFTIKEYEEFKNLCKKMSNEMTRDKKDDFDWVVAGLLGFTSGAMIGDLLSRP